MPAADTIAAVATAHGRAGIGVIRLSGPKVTAIAESLIGRIPPERRASLSIFRDADGHEIDQGISLYFRGPHSYTGEDILELQAHGGSAILRMLLQRCVELGARVAEPGEFTKRAFLNDKIDLAQAESVADLIDASSVDAARSARRSLTGEFSERIGKIQVSIIELRALVEAVLDFPEEEVDLIERHRVLSKLEVIRDSIATLSRSAVQGNLLREGALVALIGAPNVGKSSLMNRLAEEEVSIVTEVPGTTRDVLHRQLTIGGVPIHIVDTAGLRETDDLIEKAGVERSLAQMQLADITLEVRDASNTSTVENNGMVGQEPRNSKNIIINNKIDLISGSPRKSIEDGVQTVWLSARTGSGVDLLRETLMEAIGRHETDEIPFMARERHINALNKSLASAENAKRVAGSWELFAEELRLAHGALGEITGQFSADDLLGEIFSRFCIGK